MQKNDDEVVVIRRYGNRRLYDTRSSAYVNLADVRALVREGRKIRVVDANTEEDVTRRVLTQIVLEAAEEEGEKGLPLDLLYELARASDRAFRDFLDWYLKSSLEVYQRLQERWQADARRRWGDARPAFEAWTQLWDPRQVAASLSQLLSPFDLRPSGRASAGAAAEPSSSSPAAAKPTKPADDEIDELRRRLDQLERRLAAETPAAEASAPPDGRGSGKPRRP
jgi:polyhydroxyalkanoate synthesis repressor PhaR